MSFQKTFELSETFTATAPPGPLAVATVGCGLFQKSKPPRATKESSWGGLSHSSSVSRWYLDSYRAILITPVNHSKYYIHMLKPLIIFTKSHRGLGRWSRCAHMDKNTFKSTVTISESTEEWLRDTYPDALSIQEAIRMALSDARQLRDNQTPREE